MDSLNVYAPVFGLRTARITLVQFFASAAAFESLDLIAVLACFAIAINDLLDFFMNRHLFQDGIEFFQLQALRSVFLVFGRNVPAGTWLTAGFMFCAFQDYLDPIAFLCHNLRF
jgi:hypothetical protein